MLTHTKFVSRLKDQGFAILAILCMALTACDDAEQANGVSGKLVPVKFGMQPYADHTYAVIGIEKGWFREVGIDLQYRILKPEETVAFLKNGTVDVASVPPGILFSSYGNAPGLVTFVFGDLFQGYAIMAPDDPSIRNYREFVKQGADPEGAVRATVQQMKGEVFAFPTESAIKPFIDLVLAKGGLGEGEFTALVLDDPLTVAAMRDGKADFQVGGVPSRITLQKEGFRPILTAFDLAENAEPSASSPELASILQNGWATRAKFYEQNKATILRMASVNFRIIDYMNTNEGEALAIHMPFLSKVTGQEFTIEDGRIAYESLHPFYSFERQAAWFEDPSHPFYYGNVNGSILNSFIKQGAFRGNPPSVEDVIIANEVYSELVSLKDKAQAYIATIEVRLDRLDDEERAKLVEAKKYLGIFDYYDAHRVAKEVANTIGVDVSFRTQVPALVRRDRREPRAASQPVSETTISGRSEWPSG